MTGLVRISVYSLDVIDWGVDGGVRLNGPGSKCHLGRRAGVAVPNYDSANAEGRTIEIPLFGKDRKESSAVPSLAGCVLTDDKGRPWLRNLSSTQDLALRRWPTTTVDWLATDPGPGKPFGSSIHALGVGWWWVHTRGSENGLPGWALIAVEENFRARTGPIRQRPSGQDPIRERSSENVLAPTDEPLLPPRPGLPKPADLIMLARYFHDWLALPPVEHPRVRTGTEVHDKGDGARNRLVDNYYPLKKDGTESPTGALSRRGLFAYPLLERACTDVTFEGFLTNLWAIADEDG